MIFYKRTDKTEIMHIASFGFELKNINKFSSASAELILQKSMIWHKNLFNALTNNSIKTSIEYKIRKQKLPFSKSNVNSIQIAFLVHLTNKDYAILSKTAETLLSELLVIIQTKNCSKSELYFFDLISNQEHLNDFLNTPDECQVYDYTRKPVNYQEITKPLGFTQKADNKALLSFIPQFFIPDFFSINHIAQRIAQSNEFLDLTLTIKPIHLSEKDLKELKEMVDNYKLVDEYFTNYEKRTYFEHIELLLDDNTNHFLFQVRLTAKEKSLLGQSLHNSIADAFFGNILNVDVSLASEDVIPLIAKQDLKEIIPYLYPQQILRYSFRLPLGFDESINWFAHQSEIFNYFPPELDSNGVLIGNKKSNYSKKDVRISNNDLARHMYILGQTGVGKTTLMKTMIIDQINKNEGVCVVDPHGDLIPAILEMIPPNRKDDVIYFDPTQKNHNIRINILEFNPDFPEQRTFIFNEMIKMLDEIYNLRETGGPMFELYLKNAMFLIMELGGTLLDLYAFFHNSNFRQAVIENSNLKDSVDFFKTANLIKGETSIEAMANYVTSKLNRYVQDDFIAPIISSNKSK